MKTTYVFTYDSECLDLEVEAEIRVALLTGRNYAGVMCSEISHYDVLSVVTAQGEDVSYQYQGQNDLTTELAIQVNIQTEKITAQAWAEQDSANV
jgi:hypothetical protein